MERKNIFRVSRFDKYCFKFPNPAPHLLIGLNAREDKEYPCQESYIISLVQIRARRLFYAKGQRLNSISALTSTEKALVGYDIMPIIKETGKIFRKLCKRAVNLFLQGNISYPTLNVWHKRQLQWFPWSMSGLHCVSPYFYLCL